jgi:hypothetical protein
MAISGIRPYRHATPIECSVRCTCGRRYLVFTGAVVTGDGCGLVKAKADAAGLVFVDARVAPFKRCECGQSLDFSMALEVSTVM